MGVTRGVDAGLFRAWHDANKDTPLGALVSEASDDDLTPTAVENGFEPGLERMKAAVADDAAKGSTVTHEGPVTSEEMAATSDTPNDDSPRGDPDARPVVHTQEPATETQAP